MRQGNLKLPFFSMQLKNEDRTYPNVIELMLKPLRTVLQPDERTTIWVRSQIYTDNEATCFFQPSPTLQIYENLLICSALSTTETTNIISESAIFWMIQIHSKKGFM